MKFLEKHLEIFLAFIVVGIFSYFSWFNFSNSVILFSGFGIIGVSVIVLLGYHNDYEAILEPSKLFTFLNELKMKNILIKYINNGYAYVKMMFFLMIWCIFISTPALIMSIYLVFYGTLCICNILKLSYLMKLSIRCSLKYEKK